MGSSSNLFASIDMGTNSFKMLIVQADRSGKFLTIDRHKNPVCLGRDSSTSISIESHFRSLECLQQFSKILKYNNVSPHRTRCVATAALREADNAIEFQKAIHENTGLDVVVLSGEEEARFVYLGVLQFLPVFDKRVLVVDIGGGSTEFVIGEKGNAILRVSLKLGHVGLTQKFHTDGINSDMREFVRLVIKESGLVEAVKECGFEVVVGTSGTIRAIEKAVFYSYGEDLVAGNEILFRDCKRDWKFTRGELRCVVDRLCKEGEREKSRRDEFFKRRSEFILAGAVLLEEIFEVLGIDELEVSEYALGEGVIAETLTQVFEGYDLNANVRWHSVVRLATRFGDKSTIKSAARCSVIAKEVFEGLTKWVEIADNHDKIDTHLAEKDLECLQAACLLHNIGLFTGKKGYHKQTYRIITSGDYLQGYSDEEVKLIALLTRHHRKKFPKSDHSTIAEISEELKKRFRILCVIIRISVMLQENDCLDLQDMEFLCSDGGFKLMFREASDRTASPVGRDMERKLQKELAQFKIIFQRLLSVEVLPCSLETSKR
ncbi:hypothetical protein JCGZ_23247 [Jatropha curcas]|uniref:Ppx/GppA phosphatase domain-containing protein n=1 Tax=Jatropha curcas TaxID=180498 RepID=A0A067JV42_JATCU|nr:exopolyphosphatase isoform X2 [Jatropha curcas]KDP23414.1 hypothetical protein JCGZ_23247 [Jatropha curcas]